MIKRIYIINGCGGTGKDTFCDIVAEEYENSNFFVLKVSSVDIVKQCAKILGWDGVSKSEYDRKFLCDLKYISTKYNDGPFKYESMCIDKFYKLQVDGVMFVHIREPEEIKKLVGKYPEIKTILVINSNVPYISSNHADRDIEEYHYDYYVDNKGTLEEYRRIVLDFMEKEVGRHR